MRPVNYLRLAKVALGRGDVAARERDILWLTSARAVELDGIVASWVRLRAAHPVSRANAFRQLLAATRYAPPARPPTVPLLVLAGSRDRLVDPRCALDLSRRWATASAVHPAAGHDLVLDDPAWVLHQVSAWLARLPDLP